MISFFRQTILYGVVGVISLISAVYVSSFWLKPSRASTPKTLAQNSTPMPEPVGENEKLTAPPSAPAAVTPAAPAAEVHNNPLDPLSAFLEPYLYDTREGRRNPFKQSTFVEDGSLSNQLLGPSTPLERYELEELKLLAIIWDVKNPRAMFLDPTNEVHTVSKDDRIGRRRGYIAVIREGEVVVVESTTYGGEPVYSTRILRMDK